MKKIYLFIILPLITAAVFGGCKKEEEDVTTPPHAASAQTWTFGTQTWSDAIHMPDCNKTDFTDSYTEPDGRSYTEGGNTWYYYNWPYVNVNKNTMCPSPWRVPTLGDIESLAEYLSHDPTALAQGWGFGGVGTSLTEVRSTGLYWTSTVQEPGYAYILTYTGTYLPKFRVSMDVCGGIQVRCVR